MTGTTGMTPGSPSNRATPLRSRRGPATAVTIAFAAVLAFGAGIAASPRAGEARAQGVPLELEDVRDLVSRCVHFARRTPGTPALSIAVTDVEGNALGVFHMNGVPAPASMLTDVLAADSRERRTARALAKAGTASYFSSDQETFSTRTAAFIIQDHFPPGVRFMPAGPLYGVEFSSFAGSDVNEIAYPRPAAGFEARVRGDLGGIGLFKGGRRVGGLGIDDGDGGKQISIPDRILFGGGGADDYRLTHANIERGRNIEQIAVAAARPYLAPPDIRAARILVGGVRLPFARPVNLADTSAAPAVPGVDGDYDASYPVRAAGPILSRFAAARLDPPSGAGPDARSYSGEMPLAFAPRAGTDGILSKDDVLQMLWQGARRASVTRGAIRRPIGLGMQCWISVVDTQGEVLGAFRYQEDATLFSYDVAVQKARTAAFFSDDRVAWSARGIGTFAQAFYPAGQQDAYQGPLFQLQDGITVGLLTGGIPATSFALRNGITVFPGGVPVYKGGVLAGAVGVSGDGIDQDDIVATSASTGFQAPGSIRCDAVDGATLKRSLVRVLDRLESHVPADPGMFDVSGGVDQVGLSFFHERLRDCRKRLRTVPFVLGPAYVKFPRHPGPVTVR
ncbi:MAG: heme-binding protein [Planctomycetes bacterium]|nr:heme-binding protein [Planctomycetota bacterium]